MIENIIVCLLIAIIIKTTGRRNYLGWLVLSYYAIFILVELEFYGFVVSHYVFTDNLIKWPTFMIVMSTVYATLSAILFKKGSNVAGWYSCWLILNALVIFIEALDTNNAFIIDLIYTVTQNANLFVDLLVVILGTDNYINRNCQKWIGKI